MPRRAKVPGMAGGGSSAAVAREPVRVPLWAAGLALWLAVAAVLAARSAGSRGAGWGFRLWDGVGGAAELGALAFGLRESCRVTRGPVVGENVPAEETDGGVAVHGRHALDRGVVTSGRRPAAPMASAS
jgi:hypothetical protein